MQMREMTEIQQRLRDHSENHPGITERTHSVTPD